LILLYIVLDFLIANCSRDFGNRNNISQTYLYITGFLFSIVNGFSRFIWGIFMDKFGFKKLMFIITIIEIIVGSSLYFIIEFGILFIIELILVSLCIGGTFTILTPIFIQIFGLYVGPELYGLTGISIGISNISGPLLMRLFSSGENSSFLIMFLIGTGFCVIKLIVLIFFDENNKKYNDINDIKKNIDMEMTDNSPINENDSNEE